MFKGTHQTHPCNITQKDYPASTTAKWSLELQDNKILNKNLNWINSNKYTFLLYFSMYPVFYCIHYLQ